MPVKYFFLYPLTILVMGWNSSPAVANPEFEPQNRQTTPQWSETETKPNTASQWLETERDIAIPQWSLPDETNPVRIFEAPLAQPISSHDSGLSPNPVLSQPEAPIEPGYQNPPPSRPDLETIPQPDSDNEEPDRSEFESAPDTVSPLTTQKFQQPTAQQLRQGEFVIDLNTHLFFPPDAFAAAGQEEGTNVYFDGNFSWGITDNLELTVGYQHVDSADPGRQGDFDVIRTDDNEAAIELKQRLWQNSEQTLALSGVFSLSVADRGFSFRGEEGVVERDFDFDVVPAVQLPFTASVNDRLQVTLSPTIAFFGDENAAFLSQAPGDDSTFGTTFGFTGAVSYSLTERIILWGDAFIPLTGNNSVSRESGEADEAIAYNAGLRYLVNPRLAVDVFASNSLGSIGPLALTADRDLTAFGASIVFMPDFVGANRRYSDRFEAGDRAASPPTVDGLAFFDGGTLPSGRFLLNLQGGSQGILTALRYGFLEDFEGGIYLDYVWGDVDESEQGFSGKVRFLNQAQGDPLTASVAGTIGLPNQPFVNFVNSNPDTFDNRGLDKDIPFLGQGDNDEEGQFYIFTLSLPLNYQFNNGAAVWLTPIWGYVQRSGTEIAGFNVGGSLPVLDNFSVVGEVGANFADEGNALSDDGRENEIPWTVAVRWNPADFLGIDDPNGSNLPQLEFYVTNRVGSSTWHQLRVRNQNEAAVGVGLSLPF